MTASRPAREGAHGNQGTEPAEPLQPLGDDEREGLEDPGGTGGANIGAEHDSVTVDDEPLEQPAETDARWA